ncbi:MAG TPA: hypothetical protein DD381_05500 [Lentisphaeria bacterium]|nr:MAG: hypothetical protein A2X47_06960 [Lentisphaerae bacterium GWF2_38_69]HBM15786.1 hypothetical protein [Lentisphaeria bacterium]
MPYLAKNGQIGKNHTKEQVSALPNGEPEKVLTRQDISNATGKPLRTIDREIARQRNPEPDIPVVEQSNQRRVQGLYCKGSAVPGEEWEQSAQKRG